MESNEEISRLKRELEQALEREAQLLRKVHNLEEQLRYHKKKLLEYQQKELRSYVQLYRNQYKDIGRLYYCWIRTDGDSRQDKERIDAVDELLEKVNGGEDGMGLMKEDINQCFDNVLIHLESDYPKIGPAAFHLFCYLAVGFDYYLIVELLGLPGKNALYTRKSRLKKGLQSLNTPYKDSYLTLID